MVMYMYDEGYDIHLEFSNFETRLSTLWFSGIVVNHLHNWPDIGVIDRRPTFYILYHVLSLLFVLCISMVIIVTSTDTFTCFYSHSCRDWVILYYNCILCVCTPIILLLSLSYVFSILLQRVLHSFLNLSDQSVKWIVSILNFQYFNFLTPPFPLIPPPPQLDREHNRT